MGKTDPLQPQRETEVQSALNTTQQLLEQLQGEIARLGRRLDAVLRPSPATPPPPEKVKEPPYSAPLADRIDNISQQIESALKQVAEWNELIEL